MPQQTSPRVRHRCVHIAARFGVVVLLISSVLGLNATPTRVAYANSIVVNTTLDAPVPGGGLCSLRRAILNANADLDLSDGDCLAGSGADTITLSVTGIITLGSSLPDITEDLTIVGPGAANLTISGSNNGGVSIFVVSPGITFNLQDLTVANANTVAGGGIFNAGGTVSVITSTFSSHMAQVGGGISNTDGGTLTVTNSTFSGNVAEVGGGIFNTDGSTLTVINSTFAGNGRSTGQGGGIFNDNGVVSVTTSTFSENFELEGDGAGIYNASTFTVTNSTFSGNSAGGGGGGIYNSGTLDITNSTFSGNSAEFGSGGGIYNSGMLDITNSTFSGNSAEFGGGIRNEGGTVNVTNSTISGNATGDGDDFFCGVPNCIGQGGDGGHGGGIYNEGTLSVTNSTISGNATGQGGDFDCAAVPYCLGSGGDGGRGGGIYSEGTLNVDNTTVNGNATGDGGPPGCGLGCIGVLIGGDGGDGSGIYSQGVLTLTNSTISSNTAGHGGFSVCGVPCTDSSHGGSGGGIYNASTALIINSTFVGNLAGLGGNPPIGNGGGASLANGGILTLRNTIVAGGGGNCAGVITDGGNNLEFSSIAASTCGLGFITSDPLLGPLADNGGPTLTYALLSGSPAIDAVPLADCTDDLGNSLTTDQRGAPRPHGPSCDIGAFEGSAEAPTHRVYLPLIVR